VEGAGILLKFKCLPFDGGKIVHYNVTFDCSKKIGLGFHGYVLYLLLTFLFYSLVLHHTFEFFSSSLHAHVISFSFPILHFHFWILFWSNQT
jgi:hypothetical protein